LVAQLASVSLVFVAAIYLFIRLSLRWGTEWQPGTRHGGSPPGV